MKDEIPINPCISFHGSMPWWMRAVITIPLLVGITMLLDPKRFFPLTAALWCILLALLGLTNREQEFDRRTGIMTTRWKLYSVLLIWKMSEPISNYEAITCRRASSNRPPSPVEEEWIALVRPSGKFRYVRYYYARKAEICEEAQTTAQLLSRTTGLPIREYPNRIFSWQAPNPPERPSS